MQRVLSLLLILSAATLLFAGCGGDEQSGNDAAGAGASAGRTDTGCEKVADPEPKRDVKLDRPVRGLDRGKSHVATVETSCGKFAITLDVERAPKTSASFAHMAREGFYDGLTFHRVVADLGIIQGGDPLGQGTGGPGYSVREAPPEGFSYDRGVVAMAKTQLEPSGTSGSQFFVMRESYDFPPDYALVGRVSAGMETVERIGVVETNMEGRPVEPVVIRKVSVRAE